MSPKVQNIDNKKYQELLTKIKPTYEILLKLKKNQIIPEPKGLEFSDFNQKTNQAVVYQTWRLYNNLKIVQKRGYINKDLTDSELTAISYALFVKHEPQPGFYSGSKIEKAFQEARKLLEDVYISLNTTKSAIVNFTLMQDSITRLGSQTTKVLSALEFLTLDQDSSKDRAKKSKIFGFNITSNEKEKFYSLEQVALELEKSQNIINNVQIVMSPDMAILRDNFDESKLRQFMFLIKQSVVNSKRATNELKEKGPLEKLIAANLDLHLDFRTQDHLQSFQKYLGIYKEFHEYTYANRSKPAFESSDWRFERGQDLPYSNVTFNQVREAFFHLDFSTQLHLLKIFENHFRGQNQKDTSLWFSDSAKMAQFYTSIVEISKISPTLRSTALTYMLEETGYLLENYKTTLANAIKNARDPLKELNMDRDHLNAILTGAVIPTDYEISKFEKTYSIKLKERLGATLMSFDPSSFYSLMSTYVNNLQFYASNNDPQNFLYYCMQIPKAAALAINDVNVLVGNEREGFLVTDTQSLIRSLSPPGKSVEATVGVPFIFGRGLTGEQIQQIIDNRVGVRAEYPANLRTIDGWRFQIPEHVEALELTASKQDMQLYIQAPPPLILKYINPPIIKYVKTGFEVTAELFGRESDLVENAFFEYRSTGIGGSTSGIGAGIAGGTSRLPSSEEFGSVRYSGSGNSDQVETRFKLYPNNSFIDVNTTIDEGKLQELEGTIRAISKKNKRYNEADLAFSLRRIDGDRFIGDVYTRYSPSETWVYLSSQEFNGNELEALKINSENALRGYSSVEQGLGNIVATGETFFMFYKKDEIENEINSILGKGGSIKQVGGANLAAAFYENTLGDRITAAKLLSGKTYVGAVLSKAKVLEESNRLRLKTITPEVFEMDLVYGNDIGYIAAKAFVNSSEQFQLALAKTEDEFNAALSTPLHLGFINAISAAYQRGGNQEVEKMANLIVDFTQGSKFNLLAKPIQRGFIAMAKASKSALASPQDEFTNNFIALAYSEFYPKSTLVKPQLLIGTAYNSPIVALSSNTFSGYLYGSVPGALYRPKLIEKPNRFEEQAIYAGGLTEESGNANLRGRYIGYTYATKANSREFRGKVSLTGQTGKAQFAGKDEYFSQFGASLTNSPSPNRLLTFDLGAATQGKNLFGFSNDMAYLVTGRLSDQRIELGQHGSFSNQDNRFIQATYQNTGVEGANLRLDAGISRLSRNGFRSFYRSFTVGADKSQNSDLKFNLRFNLGAQW